MFYEFMAKTWCFTFWTTFGNVGVFTNSTADEEDHLQCYN